MDLKKIPSEHLICELALRISRGKPSVFFEFQQKMSDELKRLIEKQDERTSKLDAAFLSALALIRDSRVSKEMRSTHEKIILKFLKDRGGPMCQLESETIDQWGKKKVNHNE